MTCQQLPLPSPSWSELIIIWSLYWGAEALLRLWYNRFNKPPTPSPRDYGDDPGIDWRTGTTESVDPRMIPRKKTS